MMIVRAEAFPRKSMRRVFHSCKAAPAVEQRIISLRLFSLPHTRFAIGMVRIIMILVHDLDDGRGIHNAGAGMPRMPHQPVVPTGTADHKWRRIFIVKAAREDKIVDPLRRSLVIRLTG